MGQNSSKEPNPSVVNAPIRGITPLQHALSNLNLVPPPASPPTTANPSPRQWVKIGGVSVSVIQGQLTDEQVDVYVNGVPSNFDLSRIPSKKLRDAAGSALEADCKKGFPNGLKIGDIADTGGFNSKCQRVYHVTLPRSQQDGSQNKTVTKSVKNCLERANKNSFGSIAVPDLGTAIGYPASILADLMFTAVEEFSKGKNNPNLSQVVFPIFKKQVYTAFVNKAKEISTQNSVVTQKTSCKLGRIEVCLKVGKLTEQQVDVIVCSGPQDLKLKNGGMAETMLKAAGPGLQEECDKNYPNGIKYGDIAFTGGHNLPCQFVYHGALPKWGASCSTTPKQILKDFVTNCLEEANKHPMTKTLAFPTLGTGSLEYPPDEVAEVMAECIEDFNKKYPNTELTRITIVAYNLDKKWQTVQQAFFSALQMTTPTHTVTSQGPVITSASNLPPLNTKPYFKALYDAARVPPSYWTKYTSNKTLADWNTTVSQKAYELVDLNIADPQMYRAIESLALKTWQSQFVGKGIDSAGLDQLNYTKIKITSIKRLENPHLLEEYWKHREKIFLKASQKGALKSLQQISQAKNGEVLTTKMADLSLKTEIYPGINEHYLFHGTQPTIIKNILTQGLDGRVANNPVFGNGVYCAESSTKSDQYADPKQNRDLQEKQMLLVRACLGEIFVRTDTTTKYSYTRPPCQRCYKDRCTDATHSSQFFDSIVVDGGWNFREFILYDNKACYPEYLISYKRI
ncbi:protein mono-ADP-ribosyltransferase PARP14-like isoform X2 [Saccostrea echinata]|uniref:protein mono-ADP-ribosyltransferase PARP14-like isoform X2 n=1 Tax=Saccostrea echinata TaxID=191078 RepID=UPI002A822767|nr:protein mono-ADP-ribosyltransferase PARP14-like isoform X2 [Saccostrea echinata]